jgi:hypothetical protein
VPIERAAAKASPISTGTVDATLHPGEDEAFGAVAGLAPQPVKVAGWTVTEVGLVVPTGLNYVWSVYDFVADGFSWRLSITGDDYWPGPGDLIVRISYTWSSI